jgi:cyclohexa-1,5-dienecarbonyl-CoA hydratase
VEPGSVSGLQQETLADETVFHLSLDFGPGNILDLEAIGQISEVLNEVRRLEGLKALVLDHTGDHFSFGASVEDHLPDRVGEMLPRFHALALSFLGLDLPILAVVRGLCLGGGLEVALLADRIFSSPTAHFGQPEIKLAVFAPLASALLPVRIGSRQATDLLLSGRKIDAAEARDLGLIDEIADDPFAAAMDWVAQNLASSSSAALRLATRAARSNWAVGLEATLDRLERLYLDELMATADATEGIQAFLERREPRFSNR